MNAAERLSGPPLHGPCPGDNRCVNNSSGSAMPVDWDDPDDPEPRDEPVTIDRSKLPSAEEMDRILDAQAQAAKLSPMEELMLLELRDKYPNATRDELQRMLDLM